MTELLDQAPPSAILPPEVYAWRGAAPQTSRTDYLSASVSTGWWNTLAGQGQARFEREEADDGRDIYLTEGEWRRSDEFRDGLSFEPGMSRARARFNAAVFDQNRVREDVMARRDAGIIDSALGFGAMMIGGLATPENFIPFVGPAWRAAQVLRFGSIGGRAIAGAADAAIGTALATPFLQASQSSFGEDVSLAGALLDISLGAAIGGVIGAGSGLAARWAGRDHTMFAAQREYAAAADVLDRGAADLAEGRAPAISPDLVRELDALRGRVAELDTERLGLIGERDAARRSADAAGRLADIGPGIEVNVRAGADSAITFRVRYRVVEADTLITSHLDENFTPNPNFDQRLQIRERDRDASIVATRDRASNLDPAQMLASPLGTTGAPIVGPTGMVESGNGRTLSLRLAYREGMPGAAAYRAEIERLGFDTTGMREPIVVRERLDTLDDATLIRAADDMNRSPIERLSAGEESAADARLLTPDVVGRLRPGPLTSAGNADFVRAFVAALPATERAAMAGKDHALTADGLRRLDRAVQAAAYGDRSLVATLLEDTNDDLNRIGRVLRAAAPSVLAWRTAVAEGRILDQLDGTHDLVAAASLIVDARRKGQPLADLLNIPGDMFGDGPTATTRLWLSLMLDRRSNGTAAVADPERLAGRVDAARRLAQESPQAPDVLGAPPPTIRNVLATIHLRERIDLPYLPDAIRDFINPPAPSLRGPPAEMSEGMTAPRQPAEQAPAQSAAEAPTWTPDQVDANGAPIWPDDVRPAIAAMLEARARVAAQLGRPDGPDIGTHLIVTPERQQLRLETVQQWEAKRRSQVGEVRQERRAFIVMGPPAAGKSSVVEPLAKRLGLLVVDADDLKTSLPEFDGGIGAGVVHKESARLAIQMRDLAIARGDNLALPIIGRSEERVRSEIAALKAGGYHVTLIQNDLPIDKALDRVIRRFRETGRLVDPNYVLGIADKPRRNYLASIGGADEHALYSNDVPRGSRPRFIEGSSDVLASVLVDDGKRAPAGTAVGSGASEDARGVRPEEGRRSGGQQGLTAGGAAAADPELDLFASAVEDLVRAGRLTDADAATLRQGNQAGDTAAAMADALQTAAACMLRAVT